MGGVTVFVISDRTGYEYVHNWLDILLTRYQTRIRFTAVADVQSVPGFFKGLIRAKFRSSFPYSILMDWDGILIHAFDITPGYPNLIVIGHEGNILYSIHGKGSKEQVEHLSQKLQTILETN